MDRLRWTYAWMASSVVLHNLLHQHADRWPAPPVNRRRRWEQGEGQRRRGEGEAEEDPDVAMRGEDVRQSMMNELLADHSDMSDVSSSGGSLFTSGDEIGDNEEQDKEGDE